MIEFNDHFRSVVAKDAAALLLGDHLATGASRAVYAHASDTGLVVKVENGARSFDNIKEWEIWQRVKDTALARWFAPVVDIAPAGSVLVMRRCGTVRDEELPERVPAFFTDLKAENWGRLDGRTVCLDYGHNLLLERGMTKAMRKADW